MARAAANKQIAENKVRTKEGKKSRVNEEGIWHEVEHGEDHVNNKKGV